MFSGFRATSILMLVACSLMMSDSAGAGPDDRIDVPPAQRTFLSADGEKYHLVIDTVAHQAEAVLQLRTSSPEPQILWTKTLPHRFGPRSVIVGARGNVLLLDEWMKVAGDYAVMFIDVSGEVMVSHSFHDIVAATGGNHAAILRESGLSAWMAGPPALSDDGRFVFVPTGDTHMRISLDDGSLREEP